MNDYERQVENAHSCQLAGSCPEGLRDALARWPEIPEAIRRAIVALLETVPN
jgi:hypothetical protein